MKEGDQIMAMYAQGDPRAVGLVELRHADGATDADIRDWYNKPQKKRTKLLNTDFARAFIYTVAKDKMDEERAIDYAIARVPFFSDPSINGPEPDYQDPNRPLVCCLQPRVDRWLKGLRLNPCSDDELDQRMQVEGHKTVNSVIRADMAAGRL